jgi:hypothetical protein
MPITSNHRRRLHHHLALRGFVEEPVPGDGDCQFHALVDQLQQNGVTGITAKSLRRKAVKWLRDNATRDVDDGSIGEKTDLRGWLGILMMDVNITDWEDYLDKMGQEGEWGDEATLLAISVLYNVEIIVISSISNDAISIKSPPPIWNIPMRKRIFIGHRHEYHYESTRFAT